MTLWSAMFRIAAALTMLLAVLPAAAETVHFPSATTPPTPLQLRLAREHGQAVAEPPGKKLSGELYRPTSDGRFPAVVALHGCDGPASRAK